MREFKDDEDFLRFLDFYLESAGASGKIRFSDGSERDVNPEDKDIIYTKKIGIEANNIDELIISLYALEGNINYISAVTSAIAASIIIALFFVERFFKKKLSLEDELIMSIQKNIDGKNTKFITKRNDESSLKVVDKFNELIEKYWNNITELRESNTKLNSLIESMSEGILAVDNDSNIILYNEYVENLLGIDKKLLTIKDLGDRADNLLVDIMSLDKKEYLDIEVGDLNKKKNIRVRKNSIVSYKYSNKKLGEVFIFEDRTKLQDLESVRQEFVSNVSHELKTPITSIIGFLETLKMGAIEDKEMAIKFIDIIESEAMRMNRLITELLLLSEIEGDNIKIKNTSIHMDELISNIFLTLDKVAKKKNMELYYTNKSKDEFIYQNESFIRQIVLNLVENSIKYSDGGGKVWVECKRIKNDLYIKVEDNGIGISKEDLLKIFEKDFIG